MSRTHGHQRKRRHGHDRHYSRVHKKTFGDDLVDVGKTILKVGDHTIKRTAKVLRSKSTRKFVSEAGSVIKTYAKAVGKTSAAAVKQIGSTAKTIVKGTEKETQNILGKGGLFGKSGIGGVLGDFGMPLIIVGGGVAAYVLLK